METVSRLMAYQACRDGQLERLKLWKKSGVLPELIPMKSCVDYHIIAISKGHFDVLKWLVTESGQPIELTYTAVNVAAAHGQLEILKWIIEENEQPADHLLKDSEAVEVAAWNGHLAVLQWLLDCFTERDLVGDAFQALQRALPSVASQGHSHVLEFLCCERHHFSMPAIALSAAKNEIAVSRWTLIDLQRFALLYCGLDVSAVRSKDAIRTKISQATLTDQSFRENAVKLERVLDKLGIPEELKFRSPYLLSPACRLAASAHMLNSVSDLHRLLPAASNMRVQKTVRL